MNDTAVTRRQRVAGSLGFGLLLAGETLAVLAAVILYAPYISWEGITSTALIALGAGMLLGMAVSNL